MANYIMFFRRLKTLYTLTSCVLSLALLAAVIIGMGGVSFASVLLGIAAAFLCMLFMVVLFSFIGSMKYKKIRDLIKEKCMPSEYIEKADKLEGEATDEAAKNFLRLDLAMACLLWGKPAQAWQYLEEVHARNANMLMSYYAALTVYWTQLKLVDKAQEALEQLRLSLDDEKLKPVVKNTGAKAYRYRVYEIKLLRGDYEGAKLFYEQELITATAMCDKVVLNYYIGMLAAKEGNTVEAREHLEFSARNGGELRAKKLADELLAEL